MGAFSRIKANSFTLAGAIHSPHVGKNGITNRLLADMMKASPKLTAEAILYGIENDFFGCADIPTLSSSEELRLQQSFRVVLSKRRDLLRSQYNSTSLAAFSQAQRDWKQHQLLEENIADRFGPNAIPPPVDKDY